MQTARPFTTADLPASFRPDPVRESVRRAIAREGLTLTVVDDCAHDARSGLAQSKDCPECILDAARHIVAAADVA